MAFGNLFSATEISGSGLAAERLRMEVAANNIANAHSTRTLNGGAYRRQQVVFAGVMDQAIHRVGGQGRDIGAGLGGVRVMGVTDDDSPLPRVHQPGHPDADADGFVEMPNVALPREMIDLMTASRAYEANLKSLQAFRQMAEQAALPDEGQRVEQLALSCAREARFPNDQTLSAAWRNGPTKFENVPMQIGPTSPQPVSSPFPPSETVPLAGRPAGGIPFSQLMSQFLQESDQQQQAVSQGIQQLVSGQSDSIHEIAVSVAQADIAFRLVMEVRDKLISAYHDVMRMQV